MVCNGRRTPRMKKESLALRELINELYDKYKDLDEEYTSIQLSEEKWSVKEIFGHLIDSAANNYQRFIRLQEKSDLKFPGYSPDWVKVVPYNSFPYESLMKLWKEYNLLLCHIIQNMDDSVLKNSWATEDTDLQLDFLVKDYISHMKIHKEHLENRIRELNE
jgi:hypothetical protein